MSSHQLFEPDRRTLDDYEDRTAASVNVRMSRRERAYIERIARRHQVTLSEVIRQHLRAGYEAELRARTRSKSNGRTRIKVRA